jgi:hypothetical protein
MYVVDPKKRTTVDGFSELVEMRKSTALTGESDHGEEDEGHVAVHAGLRALVGRLGRRAPEKVCQIE